MKGSECMWWTVKMNSLISIPRWDSLRRDELEAIIHPIYVITTLQHFFCVPQNKESHTGFGTTWGWVNDFHFGWTIGLITAKTESLFTGSSKWILAISFWKSLSNERRRAQQEHNESRTTHPLERKQNYPFLLSVLIFLNYGDPGGGVPKANFC